MKRKPRNRRFARKHVLQVSVKTSQRRRMRMVKTAWICLFFTLLTFAIFMARQGGLALWGWAVAENDYFKIRRLNVTTEGNLRPEPIREWAGIRAGLNMFALDLNRVRRDLELIPVIDSAEIERVLPDTMKIHVRERHPVARFKYPDLRSPGTSRLVEYAVDREGVFMLPLAPHHCLEPEAARTDHLPLLLGMPKENLRPGFAIESPQVQLALRFIDAYQRSPMAGMAQLTSLDLSLPGQLHVRTTGRSRVVFGSRNLDQQLRRWRAVHDYSKHQGRSVASLDLSITNNVPLVWHPRPAHTPFQNH